METHRLFPSCTFPLRSMEANMVMTSPLNPNLRRHQYADVFLPTGDRNRRACWRKRELSEPTFRESWRSSSRNVSGSRWPYSGNAATFQPALSRAGREQGRCFRVSGAPTRFGSPGVLSLHNFNVPGERLIRLSKAMMCDTDRWEPPSWSAHNRRV